ncbi:MAG: Gfo/Idh/MocA family oxidoreductase [Bacteroidota bacterium]
MRTIKTAVVGSGFMGASHIEALRRIGGVEIAAIASDDLTAAESLARKFGIRDIYENWQKIIEDKSIEAVHNCTPNYLHFEINKSAAEAGKHILSEKPLTISSRQSKVLVELVNKKAVVNAVNFNYRFYPVIQHAKSLVAAGDVGEIYFAHGNYLQDWLFYNTDYNWRLETEISGGSRAIADIGSHWCDMIQFITGLKIKKVFADIFTIHQTRFKPNRSLETFKGKETPGSINNDEVNVNTEDGGAVIFQFENGRRGVFSVSQVSAGRKNHFAFEINGSTKSFAWNQENPNELWIGYRDKPNELLIKDPSLLNAEARQFAHYPGGHPEGYPDGPKNLFIQFYDVIRTGKNPQTVKPLFATFEDGYYENKIVEAILESSKNRCWVEI